MSGKNTVRGLSSTYWLTIAGYVALGSLLLIFTLYSMIQIDGSYSTGYVLTSVAGISLVLYSLAGVVTYPALFKDASYLRGNRHRWDPGWWKYIGFGFGVPVAVLFIATAIWTPAIAMVATILVHTVTAFIMCFGYLYRRHTYVGVP